jgi:phosphatidylglycerol:prolipoprotein diacylglycerol transferase
VGVVEVGREVFVAAGARGLIFCGYLILTGVARFLVEMIRINPRSFLGMSNAQAASVVSVILGVGLWVVVKGRAGKVVAA